MLVDDEPDFLFQAEILLEKKVDGLKLDTARSVERALEMEKNNSYDVLVSDYLLTESTGLDFLQEIRENGKDTTFIMITGKGGEDVAMRAIEWGVDRYLVKSGKPEELFEELADVLVQTVRGEEGVEEDYLIAWIEKKTYGSLDSVKKDLKDLARTVGFRVTRLDTEQSPWNPTGSEVVKAYTGSFPEIPKDGSSAVKGWKRKISWDGTILDSGVRTGGEPDGDKTKTLIGEEEVKK